MLSTPNGYLSFILQLKDANPFRFHLVLYEIHPTSLQSEKKSYARLHKKRPTLHYPVLYDDCMFVFFYIYKKTGKSSRRIYDCRPNKPYASKLYTPIY